jgi:membrane protease YdiL (CAAX protease family)
MSMRGTPHDEVLAIRKGDKCLFQRVLLPVAIDLQPVTILPAGLIASTKNNGTTEGSVSGRMMPPPQDGVTPLLLPREYQHMLRGPRHAWWRPPLTMLVALLLLAVLIGLGVLLSFLFGVGEQVGAAMSADALDVPGFLLLNLLLASLIPICILATRIVHRPGPGVMSSVAGGFRWGWFLRCCWVLAPLFVLYIALDLLLDPPTDGRPAQWGLLLLVVAASTPAQAAGEEYLFRGLILQNIGVCFQNARFALIVATLFSVVIFVAAHGSADLWIAIDLGFGAAACCFLAWRTGGLEAPIALHAINNTFGMTGSLLFGGWNEGFVSETSQGNPLEALLSVIVCSISVVLMLRLARRDGIAQRSAPLPAATLPAASRPDGTVSPLRPQRILAEGVMLIIVAGAAAWVLHALITPAEPQHLPSRTYAEIAAVGGIDRRGCLRGFIVETVPVEVRHFDSRQLVDDGVQLKFGEHVVSGVNGVFQLPVSAQLMEEDPPFSVMTPDGTRIRYFYQFLPTTIDTPATCPPARG